jgi:hypothetical protein
MLILICRSSNVRLFKQSSTTNNSKNSCIQKKNKNKPKENIKFKVIALI